MQVATSEFILRAKAQEHENMEMLQDECGEGAKGDTDCPSLVTSKTHEVDDPPVNNCCRVPALSQQRLCSREPCV